MKGGKRVLGVIIVSLLLIVSISFVSASLKDWFGFGDKSDDLEGELPASFQIGITMENSAPTIVSWSIPDGTPTSCSSPTSVTLTITVSDSDGGTDIIQGGVTAYLSKSGQFRPTSAPGTPAVCTAQAPSGNNRNFICTFQMNYYDAPGNDWIITVYAEDAQSEPATNTGGTGIQASISSSDVNYPHFEYIELLNMEYDAVVEGSAPDTIEWTSPVVRTDTANQPGDNHLKINNCGNKNLASISLTAQNLDGQTGGNTDKILPVSFSAVIGDATPCDPGASGIAILTTSPQITPSGAITYGLGQTKDLYFCLEDIVSNIDPAPIQVDSYASNSAWTIAWA